MVYSFEDVQATISGPGGSISLGAGAGNAKEGISIEFIEDKNNLLMGADGSGVHSLRASKAANISVRLLKTSPVNAQLSVMYATQIITTANWGQNELTVTNPATGDDYVCSQVAFRKFPGITWAEDANMNDWTFQAVQADPTLGTGILGLAASVIGLISTGNVQ
jgi:hypothetical protein